MSQAIAVSGAANFIAGRWIPGLDGSIYQRRAIERANSVRFGLSASVFTRSLETAQRCVDGLQAGILHVNSQTAGADVHVPFGGTKASGFGPHEQGSAAVQFYTEEVTVYQDV